MNDPQVHRHSELSPWNPCKGHAEHTDEGSLLRPGQVRVCCTPQRPRLVTLHRVLPNSIRVLISPEYSYHKRANKETGKKETLTGKGGGHVIDSCLHGCACESRPTLTHAPCPALCDPLVCTAHAIPQARVLSGEPFPSPGDLPSPGVGPRSPTLQAESSPAEPSGSPRGCILPSKRVKV